MKKPLLFLVILAMTAAGVKAQTVFNCRYKSEAELKVYVCDYKSEADLLVYKCDHKNEAKGNRGVWYFTDYKTDADKKIFFADYKSEADIKIYFCNYKSEAGWRTSSKKSLFF